MEKKVKKTEESEPVDYGKMVFTNRDAYFVRDNFGLLKGLTGFIFVRETNRNLAMIENYIKALSATIEPTDEYKETYLKELGDLEIKFADKDGDKIVRDRRGNPIISTHIFEFQKEVEKLQKKYDKVFKEHEAKIKDFNANFDEPAPLNLYTFSEKQVPANISIEQYKVIMHMIDYSKGISEEELEEEAKPQKKK
jgi:hypothetical protein